MLCFFERANLFSHWWRGLLYRACNILYSSRSKIPGYFTSQTLTKLLPCFRSGLGCVSSNTVLWVMLHCWWRVVFWLFNSTVEQFHLFHRCYVLQRMLTACMLTACWLNREVTTQRLTCYKLVHCAQTHVGLVSNFMEATQIHFELLKKWLPRGAPHIMKWLPIAQIWLPWQLLMSSPALQRFRSALEALQDCVVPTGFRSHV